MPKADKLSPGGVKLLQEKLLAHFVTVLSDGSPQVTPVWVDVEDGVVLVNTARGRIKVRNVEADPRVALSVHEQQNPYNEVCIQGEVVEVTEEGADAHIDALARKYLGEETYPFRAPGERRVIFKIRPKKVFSSFS